MKADRKFIFEYAKENYGTEPEYSKRQIKRVFQKKVEKCIIESKQVHRAN